MDTLLRFPEIQGLLSYFARTAQCCTEFEHYHSMAGSIWIPTYNFWNPVKDSKHEHLLWVTPLISSWDMVIENFISSSQLWKIQTCSCPFVRYFRKVFWDDITIIWYENIGFFNCFGPIRSFHHQIILISSQNIVRKYHIIGHEQVCKLRCAGLHYASFLRIIQYFLFISLVQLLNFTIWIQNKLKKRSNWKRNLFDIMYEILSSWKIWLLI